MTDITAVPEPRQGVRTLAIALGLALAAQAGGAPLGGMTATVLACLAILILGLPHGALDLALIRREGTGGARGIVPLVVLYLACAGATLAVWQVAPVFALGLFLAVATAHFAEDWEPTGSPFLSLALAGAILSAPALLHRPAMGEIFVALTGLAQGVVMADLLLLAAPTALVGALAALYALVQAGRADLAWAAGISLTGLLVLPPAVGFAIFFGLCHSPRHLGEALHVLSLRRVRQWVPAALPTMLGAVAIGVLLYRLAPAGAPDMRLAAATFMLLSVLSTPHMLAPLLLRIRWRTGATRMSCDPTA